MALTKSLLDPAFVNQVARRKGAIDPPAVTVIAQHTEHPQWRPGGVGIERYSYYLLVSFQLADGREWRERFHVAGNCIDNVEECKRWFLESDPRRWALRLPHRHPMYYREIIGEPHEVRP